ncbi:FUSC family protein [Agathobaculum sp.]|uniref:FUSC family protein n=1 Tax=Agathobaculum sp. TaxID=2048138 RepID=UPI002A82BE41|nr:aromatic acid exporter family protein [Agathobaculum sp.]MDY3618030.1 aromatic acid exporter family protein [Agathobaculum sp.]
MAKLLPHIGLRTVKTAAAVALALWLADLRGSPAPIFAAIGAIVAMNRTLGDAKQSCLTQLAGIALGAGFGWLFVTLFEEFRYIGIGLGIIALILMCVKLRLQFAVPLACIVFVSICLSPADGAFLYSVNRLADTTIGLGVALALNIAVRPYNNRGQIAKLLTHFLQSVPGYLTERVAQRRYPDLSGLDAQLSRLADELEIYEKQNFPRSRDHGQQAVYLRGCEQLAQALLQELHALCAMDEMGRPSPENAKRLADIGVNVPEGLPAVPAREADVVMGYHLGNLLDAYGYLSDFSLME